MSSQLHNGWTIKFSKNVHMYYHHLCVSKGTTQVMITCEDIPISDGTAMWLYDLNLDETTFSDLKEGLVEWAEASGMKFRIYTTKRNFETIEKSGRFVP